MFCVYCHENPKNGEKYIGITSQKPEQRWLNGEGYKQNKKFYRDIKKYGWDFFAHTILAENLSQEDAVQMESELILQYDCIKNGYNRNPGGHYGKAGFLSPKCTIIKNTTKKFGYFQFWNGIFENANSNFHLANNINQYIDAIIESLRKRHNAEINLEDEVDVAEVLYELQYILEIIKYQENGGKFPEYKPMHEKIHEILYGEEQK